MLEKLSDGVFRSSGAYSVLTPEYVNLIKEDALANHLKRSRINFHDTDESSVHEMILCLHESTRLNVHRHINKTESFHLIEGVLAVVLFANDSTGILDTIIIRSGYSSCFYRLNHSIDHLVVPLSEFVIMHETTSGPFSSDLTIQPIWSKSTKGKAMIRSIVSNLRSTSAFFEHEKNIPN